jgi:hypothetical protein
MNDLQIESNKSGFVTTVKPATSSSKLNTKNDDKLSLYQLIKNKIPQSTTNTYNCKFIHLNNFNKGQERW